MKRLLRRLVIGQFPMRRLSLSLLLVVLLATIGFGWALDRLFIGLQPDDADRLAPYRVMGESLVGSISSDDELIDLVSRWPRGTRVQLSSIDSSAVALPLELQEELNQVGSLALETSEGVTLIVPRPGSNTALAMDLPPLTSTAESALRFALTILFYAGIVALILLWVYPLVRRLHGLSKVANEFGAGNFNARVPESRFSLINHIESEFNAMAGRIATLVEDNRLLSTAVSHDLRTPIARLRFGLDALSEESNPAVKDKYMQRISNDLAEMEHLVEVLLDYARLEKQKRELPLQPVNIASRLTDRIDALAHDAPLDIHWQEPAAGVWVMANERYLDMAINNVLQNAQRYGQSNITVSLKPSSKTDPHVWVYIEDDGSGIPEEERSRVLKPFERGQANSVSSGFGMGLAIVQRILDWHGAKLVLHSSETLGGASIQMGFVASSTHVAKA